MGKTVIAYGPIKELLSSFLAKHSYSKIAILVDENTKKFCLPLLPRLKHIVIEIRSGETFKNVETCSFIWESLLEHKLDRQSLLINLGGGVITDMGGFSASCFKRGIDFINIPTTLLAMVDASIGAKTGVDFGYQKNMIGLFSPAQKVLIDPTFLKTLEQRQILSGKAEMLKHGIIASKNHFDKIVSSESIELESIKESIEIKAKIVAQDPTENGLRKSLNFGHTLGHALETWSLKNDKDILHGEAVAQGMIWAIQLSIKYNNYDKVNGKGLIAKLEKLYGKKELSKQQMLELIAIAENDKKNDENGIHFCLLKNEYQLDTSVVLAEKDILLALAY